MTKPKQEMTKPKLAVLPTVKPNDRLVELLHDLLGQAEVGELRGIVATTLYRNDETQSAWAVENPWAAHVLGAICMLQRDWQDRILEQRD